MAGRSLNRRDLRRQAEMAERAKAPAAELPAEAAPEPPAKARKARKPAAPRKSATPGKPRAPKAPPRMRARWCIYDGGMKAVAVFDYNQRANADARLAELMARAKGLYFLAILKEAMPPAEPHPAG